MIALDLIILARGERYGVDPRFIHHVSVRSRSTKFAPNACERARLEQMIRDRTPLRCKTCTTRRRTQRRPRYMRWLLEDSTVTSRGTVRLQRLRKCGFANYNGLPPITRRRIRSHITGRYGKRHHPISRLSTLASSWSDAEIAQLQQP